MKNFLILLCFFILSACYQPSRIKEDSKREQVRIAQDNLNATCRELFMDVSLDVIRNKVAFNNVDNTTLEMLTDQTIPTDEEKAAIEKWVRKRSYCIQEQITINRRASAPEHFIAMYQIFNDRQLFLITDLYKGSLTYGEFNKRRKEQM